MRIEFLSIEAFTVTCPLPDGAKKRLKTDKKKTQAEFLLFPNGFLLLLFNGLWFTSFFSLKKTVVKF